MFTAMLAEGSEGAFFFSEQQFKLTVEPQQRPLIIHPQSLDLLLRDSRDFSQDLDRPAR